MIGKLGLFKKSESFVNVLNGAVVSFLSQVVSGSFCFVNVSPNPIAKKAIKLGYIT